MPCKGYNPLTPTISSSNRGGGVAPDCMDFALKVFFPWLQAPFCLWSVRISECDTKADCKEGGGVSTTTPALLARVHLFNSGLLYHGGTFWSYFGFLIFLAFRLFPWELIRTLASENKTRPYWIWSGFVLYWCTVINSIRELITKVMWFDDRHKIQDKISVLFNYYNDTRFKINPLFVLNCLK